MHRRTIIQLFEQLCENSGIFDGKLANEQISVQLAS